ncbi:LLM class flavin-dependent oxidoreductase [Halostagnicola kamekurae]|uniref:Flavin-dependent oxidoreductase, luciferase family (Includes alkanesulfonate monooxygenase SsuD and methylene tetrahydromethanopterin reductase) n=1 Tax=Halostagnicola kamekurae TaxID=619731 RepID=A0A1I6RR97_9EURY|nr:LLM class flavin-dependent oxidoreductase [Halostagnicola kamekurae]SFS67215.1 Flavin-dependent oxidoreductase, luciferase family (includes alkanesulfonate monooxygenase SsuD and methylene tetrahydromethanopterin reductase) [Halostagnicola kamekurae]
MKLDLIVSEFGGSQPADLATRAESLGYDRLWLTELWGENAAVQLAEMAAATDEIGLGTAIVNVYSRSPALLSMTANSLERASDGRFVLGTGVSTKKVIEDLHGESFDRPVRRAHETIELVRQFTAGDGERVRYDGELLEVADFPALEADVPLYHAGLGPANRRVVGRLCDGWIPHNIPFSGLEAAFETVADAARERGRDPDDVTVAPYVPTAASDDPEHAREILRRHVAYYVGSGEGYRNAVATEYEREAERIANAWRTGAREEATGMVTDEMVDDLGVAGDPATVRTRLRELAAESIVDRPIVVIPEPASESLREETVRAAAPKRD